MAALLSACHHPTQPQRLYGKAQGTDYSVQYCDSQQRDLQRQVDSLLEKFDQSASLWVEHSLLRRINDGLTDTLDPILLALVCHSEDIRLYTDGAFDCRVGRLVQSWGFSFRQRQEPDSAALAVLLQASHAAIGLSADSSRLVKEDPATELDFNAIAQGYAVDLIANMLDSLGIGDYLIDVGGEVIARGTKPDGSPWRVGIERPAANRYSAPEVQTAIPLQNCALVTSGSYRKYYEKDGLRYSHTIDPSTGRPVQHTLLSVSVVESHAWLADAMATAYMVMGLDRAKAFIAAHPDGPGTQAVYFIYDSGDGYQTYATPQFQAMQTKY